jgi:hypothetical protein
MPGASHPIISHPIHPPCYPASAAWAARGRGHERGHGLRQTCSIALPGTERPNRECTTRPGLFVPYVQYSTYHVPISSTVLSRSSSERTTIRGKAIHPLSHRGGPLSNPSARRQPRRRNAKRASDEARETGPVAWPRSDRGCCVVPFPLRRFSLFGGELQ